MTPFAANGNSEPTITEEHGLANDVERAVKRLLDALAIDQINDENSKGTAHRVAKMFVCETFKGRFTPPPDCTVFPNTRGLDELILTGPISVRSTCSHHLCLFNTPIPIAIAH